MLSDAERLRIYADCAGRLLQAVRLRVPEFAASDELIWLAEQLLRYGTTGRRARFGFVLLAQSVQDFILREFAHMDPIYSIFSDFEEAWLQWTTPHGPPQEPDEIGCRRMRL